MYKASIIPTPISYIFSHGWGCASSFWEPLLAHITVPFTLWERGYYTEHPSYPTLSSSIRIGIGHSLGYIHLLTSGVRFDAYILLQSFVNFLGSSALYTERKHMLDNMYMHMQKKPYAVVSQFCRKNMLPKPSEHIYIERLLEDFCMLYNSYHDYTQDVPMQICTSTNDAVVPILLLQDNFPALSIHVINGGGHGLGFTKPAEVALCIENRVLSMFPKNCMET